MTIYTVTFLGNNYGSILQAFALQSKLKELGADPVILIHNRKENRILRFVKNTFRFIKPNKIYTMIERFKTDNLQRWSYREKNRKLSQFVQERIKTVYIDAPNEFAKNLGKEDILLAGSDQVWSMENSELDWYTFNWGEIPEEIKRVSYAASIGFSKLTDKSIAEYGRKLSKFNYISFREKQALDSLEGVLPCRARNDLDPTLLYDQVFWSRLSSDRMVKNPYIFVYMLRPDATLIKMAKELAGKKNCEVYYTGLLPDRYPGVKTIYNAGIGEFLSYIKYAEYVITNSFHGTIFCILFRKQFVTINIAFTSSRVENILQIAGIPNRMIKNSQDMNIIEEKIDFDLINEKFIKKRLESIEYLKDICRLSVDKKQIGNTV